MDFPVLMDFLVLMDFSILMDFFALFCPFGPARFTYVYGNAAKKTPQTARRGKAEPNDLRYLKTLNTGGWFFCAMVLNTREPSPCPLVFAHDC